MAFSDKSKSLREEFNLTQTQLAQALNVSRSCISMIEIGRNEPTSTTLIAYSNFFKISVDELLDIDFGAPATAPIYDTGLSSEERKIIDDYRSLNPECQKLIKSTIKTLLASSAGNAQNKNRIS